MIEAGSRLEHYLMVFAMVVGCAGCGGTGRSSQDTRQSTESATGLAPLPDVPYLGQPVPGVTPELFAPGIVSTDAIELNSVFSADGRECYFTRIVDGLDTMHQISFIDGRWGTARELMLFPGLARVESADMAISSDGQELYFLARYDRAGTGPTPNYDIWVSRRVNGTWSPAELVRSPISTAADELYPVLGADGSLYFNSNRSGRFEVYRAQRRSDGGFDAPVEFGPAAGENGAGDLALAPDESYLVTTPRIPGGLGEGDVHVSFRRTDGSWTDLIRLDDTINTSSHEWCPMVTPDGKYLFFSRLGGPAGPPWPPDTIADVYWVDARVLDQYRPRAGAAA
jgi:hypothetical protein